MSLSSSYNVEVLRDLSKRAEDVCDLLNREVDKVCKEHHKAAKKTWAGSLLQNVESQCWRPTVPDKLRNPEKGSR